MRRLGVPRIHVRALGTNSGAPVRASPRAGAWQGHTVPRRVGAGKIADPLGVPGRLAAFDAAAALMSPDVLSLDDADVRECASTAASTSGATNGVSAAV